MELKFDDRAKNASAPSDWPWNKLRTSYSADQQIGYSSETPIGSSWGSKTVKGSVGLEAGDFIIYLGSKLGKLRGTGIKKKIVSQSQKSLTIHKLFGNYALCIKFLN